MNWRELQDKNITLIGGAVSGGLDSCTATHWLTSKGFDVTGGTVDLGQPDEETSAPSPTGCEAAAPSKPSSCRHTRPWRTRA